MPVDAVAALGLGPEKRLPQSTTDSAKKEVT